MDFILEEFIDIANPFENDAILSIECSKKSFVMQEQLDIHMKACKMKYCCDLCDQSFPREYELVEHLCKHHGQTGVISVIN